MKTIVLAATALMFAAVAASAQSLTSEADATAGVSTENVRTGSTQLRLFGANASDWRFFSELSLAGTGGHESDAFSAAYPYDQRVHAMEVFVEKTFHPGKFIAGLRAGRYRTPFGIYSRADYGYSGFVRPPLIRYGEEFALSNTYLESGVNLIGGLPQLYGEASFAAPSDEGELHRQHGLDTTVRVQGYYKGLVAGASRLRSGHNRELDAFAHGDQTFNGFDARWMYGGVQLRGEWIFGAAFDGVRTKGGYIDVSVHRQAFGAVTPVARVERLDYDAGPFSFYHRRFTGGARVHVVQWLTAQVNVIHQPGGLSAGRVNVVDAGVTVSLRR